MTIKFIDKSELIIGSATIPENVTFRFSDILKLGGGGDTPSWQDITLSGNGSLTLVNAKANSLTSLKLFGGTEQLPETYIDSVTLDGKCEQNGTPTPTTPVDIVCNNGAIKAKRQSGLPLGYQMVEWLKSTGSIVITGFKTKSTQEIETVFYRERSGASYLYSSDTATSGTTNTTAYLTSGAGNWRWDGKSYSINVPTGIEVTSIQKNDGVWLNGTKSGTYSDAVDFVSTNDLRLSSGENTTVRIYSQTIREGEITTLDLVPVQRLSDSSYGFYDKVSGEFYTNTEATFVVGDVIDDPVEIYTDGTVETVTDNVGNVATAEMLLSVDDYKDTQEVLTGAVTRNVGIKVLDGTEDGWSKANKSFSNTQICPDKIDSKLPMLCTHFVYHIGTTGTITDLKFGCSNNGTNVFFRYDTISTVEDWQTWLANQYANGTPVIVVYQTSSPTTETVTGQFLSKEPVTVTGSLTGLVANVVSSSHTTPTPTQPLPINCNNGVLKYGVISKNLFDPTKVLFGYYRNRTTGDKLQSAVNFMSSDDGYIPCLPNTTYTFVGTNKTNGTYSMYNTIYFFDSAKNYLGASQYEVSQPTTDTTPNNCYYLQVRSNPLDKTSVSIQDAFSWFNWQLELGSTATEYEPYQEGIYTDGTTETVEITGQNLLDLANCTDGYYYDPNGVYSEASSARLSNFVQVKANETYTVFVYGLKGSANVRVNLFDKNKTWLSQQATPSTLNQYTAITVTTTQDGYLAFSANFVTTGSCIDWTVSQIIKGSYTVETMPEYEPYYNGGSATAEMLLKVGDYKDEQSVLNGHITRNVGIKVLDGTEDWTISSASNNLFYSSSAITNADTSNAYEPMSTHFIGRTGSTGYATMRAGDFKHGSGNSIFYFKIPNLTTVAECKQWLADQYNAGTPVIVIYPISSPTTETVTGQHLHIQAGTNTVAITQASIDNLPLEVSYKGTV